jgi:hypothetical protein
MQPTPSSFPGPALRNVTMQGQPSATFQATATCADKGHVGVVTVCFRWEIQLWLLGMAEHTPKR